MRGLTLALLLMSACLNEQSFSFKDEGQICVWPSADQWSALLTGSTKPVMFVAERRAYVTVTMPTCLSSSCSRDAQAVCEVRQRGPSELEVFSEGSQRDVGNTCTSDCGFLVAQCETPVLSTGTYAIRHGSERLTVTLPSMTAPPCAGKR